MVEDLTRPGDTEDERFEFQLDVQLRGIAALVDEHHAGRGVFNRAADAAPGT